MFEKLRKKFRRKNYANPYYGKGNKPLMTSLPSFPVVPEEEFETRTRENPDNGLKVITRGGVSHVIGEVTADVWEQRRYEMMKMLVAQERRSVVLGKLKASNKQIARNCRLLTDASIKELRTNKFNNDDTRREGDDG